LAAFAEDSRFTPGITQARHDDVGFAQVLPFGVEVAGGQNGDAGRFGGTNPVGGILDHETFARRQPRLLEREQVDLGVRLFLFHNVAGQNEREGNVLQDFGGDGIGGLLVRGCADAELQPAAGGLLHEALHPGPQRQAPALDEFDENGGLAEMQLLDEFRFRLGRHLGAKTLGMQIMLHPLLAAANLKQGVVFLHVPLEPVTELAEGLVESDPMAVALGVDDDAVLIEENGFE